MDRAQQAVAHSQQVVTHAQQIVARHASFRYDSPIVVQTPSAGDSFLRCGNITVTGSRGSGSFVSIGGTEFGQTRNTASFRYDCSSPITVQTPSAGDSFIRCGDIIASCSTGGGSFVSIGGSEFGQTRNTASFRYDCSSPIVVQTPSAGDSFIRCGDIIVSCSTGGGSFVSIGGTEFGQTRNTVRDIPFIHCVSSQEGPASSQNNAEGVDSETGQAENSSPGGSAAVNNADCLTQGVDSETDQAENSSPGGLAAVNNADCLTQGVDSETGQAENSSPGGSAAVKNADCLTQGVVSETGQAENTSPGESATAKNNEPYCIIPVDNLTSQAMPDMHYAGANHRRAVSLSGQSGGEGIKRKIEEVSEVYNVASVSNDVAEVRDVGAKHKKRPRWSQDIEVVQQLKEQNNQLRERTMCKVCMDKEVAVVFLPCGHFVSCTDCAAGLKDCPVCRNVVRESVRAFMA